MQCRHGLELDHFYSGYHIVDSGMNWCELAPCQSSFSGDVKIIDRRMHAAAMLALLNHDGQLDKSGQPYFLHVARVAAAGKTWREQTVGFLHDILEDTKVTVEDLRERFDNDIVDAVIAITRQRGETYPAYINRAAKNPLARVVKQYDLQDNIRRLGNLPEREASGLRRRYMAAYCFLEDKKVEWENGTAL